MNEKALVIKEKAKELWREHGHDVVMFGTIAVACWAGNRIGYVEGYAKCLVDVIRASCGETAEK